MLCSGGKSFYWTDKPSQLMPHQIKAQVQGDGGEVVFWGMITAEKLSYGSTITEGTVNLGVYMEILETSLWNTMVYFGLDKKTSRLQQDNGKPHTSVPTKEWFKSHGFSLETFFNWPVQSPDLNPIEHVRHQLKPRLNKCDARPNTTL